jgi:hypothetical protein
MRGAPASIVIRMSAISIGMRQWMICSERNSNRKCGPLAMSASAPVMAMTGTRITTMTIEQPVTNEEDIEPMTRPMEDWRGSELDTKPLVQLQRAFNGVLVTHYDISRDRHSETLVFQDMDKLVDWLDHWYAKTNRGAKL